MSGWKDWAIGEVVTESEFQSFVQDQVVQVYDDATDRDNTLGANVTEGMVCYLKDVDETQVYNGSDWEQVGQGTITEVVAGNALTGGGTSGSVTLNVDESEITLAQSQVTDLETDLSNKASTTHASTHESGGSDEIQIAQSQVTGLDTGTEGFTAVSNGSSGLSYQPISHNYIINGAFDIWQRGDGPTQIVSDSFLADRFKLYAQGPDFQVSKSTDAPDNFDFSTKIQRDSGSTDTLVSSIQYVPENAGRILAGKEYTWSFYAKVGADFSGNLRLVVGSTSAEPQNIANFTSGQIRGTNPDYATSLSILSVTGLTTSWQRFSYTGTLDSLANGVQFFMTFEPEGTAGADDSVYTTGWQLEAGSIATPFKRNANSIAGELAACQRYYYRVNAGAANPYQVIGTGHINTSSAFSVFTPLKVTMRAKPSVSSSGSFRVLSGSGASSTSPSQVSDQSGPDLVAVAGSQSGLGTGNAAFLQANNDSDAYVEFSSEL